MCNVYVQSNCAAYLYTWENTAKSCGQIFASVLYAEYSPSGSNLLFFPCQVEEKSETIRCLEDDLLRELEEKLLERSQIMDPGVMAELERELELANSKADVSLACTHAYCFNGFYGFYTAFLVHCSESEVSKSVGHFASST